MVKVKLSLALINYAPRLEDVWGSGGMAHLFLTLAPDGGKWSPSYRGRFTPGKSRPRSPLYDVGGWVGPKAGRDVMEKKNSCPYRESSSP
jgi:hypothetical protein